MRFNPRARIDRSQIEVRRGGGGGGGGGGMLPIPMGGRGRMGLGTVVLLIVIFVLSQWLGGGGNGNGSGAGNTNQAQNTCHGGADANRLEACSTDLFVTSIQDFWSRAYPQQTGDNYQPVHTVRFSGSTQSGCGQASTQMGPFYCPNDQKVYLDTTFFDDMLQGQLGARGGTFSIGYVVAHEYGHHIEDQLGILGKIRSQQGAKSDSVRVELMADCLAGVWANGAQSTRDAQGRAIVTGLNQDDVKRAIDAAQAVGDDRIQKRTSGRVNPDSFTHGTAAQRVRWFDKGMQQGTIRGCDTFSTNSL